MKNTILIILLVCAFGLTCCKKETKQLEGEYLSSFLEDMSLKDSIEWIVILPGMGCHGCIQEGEAFMKRNISNSSILFVLTKVESLKVLQNKLEVKLSDYSNVCIDKNNEFRIPSNNSIYPCIIKMKKGEVIMHEFQSPNNGQAFENLKSKIR